ncbi:MAG: hypothetical protein QM747_04130 [Nocardioides sp.]
MGKTHTMLHLQYVINNGPDFPAEVVFIELPDIGTRSTFQVAHGALLDALGLDRVRQWFTIFQTKHGADARDLVQEATQSGDIATAFQNILGMGDAGRIAWDWLRGEQLTSGEGRMAGLPPRLDQSNALVKVLEMLGKLCREAEEKVLVLMVDEATKLSYVTNTDALNHWTNAFKLIANMQVRDIGLIVSGSWAEVDDMALPLMDEQVRTRFGDNNYIRLSNLDEEESVDFMNRLLEEWVDPVKRTALISAHTSQAGGETIGATTFPFTEPALRTAAAYACRHGGWATPRDIQQSIDDLLNRAIDDNVRIVNDVYLQSLVNA